MVADLFQGMGLGHELLARMIEIARKEGLKLLYADTPVDAPHAQRLLEHAGFRFERGSDNAVLIGKLALA